MDDGQGGRNKSSDNTGVNRLPSLIYDASASNWYQKAISERKLIFTNVREFMFTKKLGLFCAIPYFDANNEMIGVAGAQASLERINEIAKEVKLHNTGFCFVTDNRGYVILNSEDEAPIELAASFSADIRDSENDKLSAIGKLMIGGKIGIEEVKLNSKEYYIAYAPIESMNWSFGAAISKEEIILPAVRNSEIISRLTGENIAELNAHLFRTMLLMTIFIFVLLMSVTYVGRRLSDHFVEPIHKLSDGVREISSGNLDKKLEIKTGDEIEHLATCFNAMTDELQRYMKNLTKITAEKERIATELEVAKNIQASMLPNIFPPFPDRKEIEIIGGMEDIDFVQQKIKFTAGDEMFLYTDGLTEALNENNEQYGEKKLLDCLNRAEKSLTVEELLKKVRGDVKIHVGGAEQSDDITMLILKLTGGQSE